MPILYKPARIRQDSCTRAAVCAGHYRPNHARMHTSSTSNSSCMQVQYMIVYTAFSAPMVAPCPARWVWQANPPLSIATLANQTLTPNPHTMAVSPRELSCPANGSFISAAACSAGLVHGDCARCWTHSRAPGLDRQRFNVSRDGTVRYGVTAAEAKPYFMQKLHKRWLIR